MGRSEYIGGTSSSIVGARGDQMILEVFCSLLSLTLSLQFLQNVQKTLTVGLWNLAIRLAKQKILMYHLYNIHYQIL